MKKLYPYHSILFALIPILHLYSQNEREVFATDMLLPLAFNLLLIFVFGLFARFLSKDWLKVALLASIYTILFNSYGHIFAIRNPVELIRHRYLVPLFLLFFLFFTILITKSKKNLLFTNLTKAMNIVALVMFLMPLLQIFSSYLLKNKPSPAPPTSSFHINTDGIRKPDVLYIILDERPGLSTLQQIFDYDDSEFENKLKELGFHIPSDTRSNYAQTTMSLASTLNMNYLQYLLPAEIMEDDLYKLVQNAAVFNKFKALGYDFININSGIGLTSELKLANNNFNSPTAYLSPLFNIYLRNTMLCTLEYYFSAQTKREYVNYAFEKLNALAKSCNNERAEIIFAHIVSPHEPFIFTESGGVPDNFSYTEFCEFSNQCDPTYYIAQLKYINSRIIEVTKTFIEEQEDMLILVHSDHGSSHELAKLQDGNKWINPNNTMIQERMSNFCAVYSNQELDSSVYNGITPVNYFRLVFNNLFHTSLPLLDDKCFFAGYYTEPYTFKDVTNK